MKFADKNLFLSFWNHQDLKYVIISFKKHATLTNVIFFNVCFTGHACGYPGSPRNGSVSSSGLLFYTGEEVTFTCQEGFVLFGPETRTCLQNGSWSLAIPECRKHHHITQTSTSFILFDKEKCDIIDCMHQSRTILSLLK